MGYTHVTPMVGVGISRWPGSWLENDQKRRYVILSPGSNWYAACCVGCKYSLLAVVLRRTVVGP